MDEARSALFVTGMQRSGTTLLEKLLASHPGISVLSQPFPLLAVEVKREFLRRLGHDDPYPLGPLFLERRYDLADFPGFLRELQLGASEAAAACERMAGFGGQYTRFERGELAAALERLAPGDLAAVLAQLYRSLARGEGASLWGAKETLWEELLPYLLDRGFRCLLIVRDPRDVLASLNCGRGEEHAGRVKPTLFNLRNWRKSVAFALHLEPRPGFAWIRYEDLVARPAETLGRVAEALGVGPFPGEALAGAVRDQGGGPWPGNSSHGPLDRISAARVGSWRDLLPPAVARYAEAACHPELRRLGYPVSLGWDEVPGVLASFEDPYELAREELRGYADRPARAAEELERLAALEDEDPARARTYFLFAGVHAALRRAVST